MENLKSFSYRFNGTNYWIGYEIIDNQRPITSPVKINFDIRENPLIEGMTKMYKFVTICDFIDGEPRQIKQNIKIEILEGEDITYHSHRIALQFSEMIIKAYPNTPDSL